MTVVSNTTPLNYLVLIGRADILRALYQTVMIPEAVFLELTSQSTPELVKVWILSNPDWLRVGQTPDLPAVELDEVQIGERQAIVLAQQLPSDLIILDDRRARRLAQNRGLNVIGTIGVLTVAAEKGLIILDEAVEDLKKTNFRASFALLQSLSDRNR
jgi:predicted nucleic acid-binding protein